MSKKKEAKDSSKKERELQQQRERQEKQREEEEARQREEHLKERSSPLIDYGLIDAYEHFMIQLTQAGIPQPNLYEFAAQTILKYEKSMKMKMNKIQAVNEFNQRVIKESPIKNLQKSSLRGKRLNKQAKLLPFQLTEEEKRIINQKEKEKLAQKEASQEEQYEMNYSDDYQDQN